MSTKRQWWEIVIVLLLSYGMSAVYSLVSLLDRLSKSTPLKDQTATLNRPLATQEVFDFIYQILGILTGFVPVALVLWLVWSATAPHFSAIGLGWRDGFSWRQMAAEKLTGLGLAALIGIPGIGVYLVGKLWGIGVTVVPTSLTEHWWTVPVLILWAFRAGIGEEVIVVGYLFNRLRRLGWSPWVIVLGTAVLRGSYHLYQGFGAFVGNLLMGVIFGFVYLRKGRLLPLVTAHALIDTAAFVGYPVAVAVWPGLFYTLGVTRQRQTDQDTHRQDCGHPMHRPPVEPAANT